MQGGFFTRNGLVDEQNMAFQSPVVFLDTVLRGVGQVMLQNNSYAGLLFLAGIAVNSYLLALAVFLGALFSSLAALFFALDKVSIRTGLYGFNGALIGLALFIFLSPDSLTFITLFVAAAFSSVLLAALNQLLKAHQVPAFTAPFVIISWLVFLSSARFGRMQNTDLLPTAGLPVHRGVEGIVTWQSVLDGSLNGIGQVFFQGSVITGLIFLAALLISSRLSAVMAVLGALSGVLVAWLWGASEASIQSGAFGFNSVLVAIALPLFLGKCGLREWAYVLLAVLVTPFVFAALSACLEPIGMPAMTMPFVLVTWLFLLANPVFFK